MTAADKALAAETPAPEMSETEILENEMSEIRARLEQVRGYLRAYPASVVAASYAGDAPPLKPLAELVTRGELGRTPDPVLTRFIERLKRARPDLSQDELLALAVPLGAGDQEVYTARLGKWLFEQRILEQALSRSSDSLEATESRPLGLNAATGRNRV